MLVTTSGLSKLSNPGVDPCCSIFSGATDIGIFGSPFIVPGIGTAGVGAGVVISDKRLKLLEPPDTVVPDEGVGV